MITMWPTFAGATGHRPLRFWLNMKFEHPDSKLEPSTSGRDSLREVTRHARLFHVIILALVSTSLLCCGCSSVALSPKEKLAITDFVQTQTGQHVLALELKSDGSVAVETEVKGSGFDSTDLWLLKRGPGGWKLIKQGRMTL